MPARSRASPARRAAPAGTVTVATPSAPVSACAPPSPHQRPGHRHAAAVVVVAAHAHAQRRARGDGAASGRASSVRWQPPERSCTHQNHSSRPPRSRRPVPNGPEGSAAPVVPARVPTL